MQSPQLYLVTPPSLEQNDIPALIGGALDAAPIACLRIRLATSDEATLMRATDAIREAAHARDVAVVIDTHFRMVAAHGLDGVHLQSGSRHLREARKLLGKDAIVGAFCGTSKHDGLTAAEIGADYISFGPVSASGKLGDGTTAPLELFSWWSEMIETPVMAEGGLGAQEIEALKGSSDFLCLSSEIWDARQGPVAALKALNARLS